MLPPLHAAPGRKALTLMDHMVIVAASGLPLGAVLRATDPGSLSPNGPGAAGFSAVLLAIGYCLWWLPAVGARGRRGWLDSLALPAFMALVVVDLVLTMLAFLCDPDVAVLVVAAQLVVLVYVSLRS